MTSWIVTIPDSLKTQEVCDEEVKDDPSFLQFVPDHIKTQEMCEKVKLKLS